MLIALLLTYFLGGGGASAAILTPPAVSQIKKQVKRNVADPARAAAATVVLADLKDTARDFDKAFKKSGKELARLYKDHEAQPTAMEAVLAELETVWGASQKEAVELRFQLKDSLTAEEWEAVFGSE